MNIIRQLIRFSFTAWNNSVCSNLLRLLSVNTLWGYTLQFITLQYNFSKHPINLSPINCSTLILTGLPSQTISFVLPKFSKELLAGLVRLNITITCYPVIVNKIVQSRIEPYEILIQKKIV